MPYFAQTHDRDISKVQTESGLMMLEKLQNVMTVTDSLCQFWQPLGKGVIVKRIFGLQRHTLLMGDRHESSVDVLLWTVRRPGSNAR